MGREEAGERAEFDPRRILFQEGGLLAVNKPAGIPVHQGTGHELGLVETIGAWASVHPGILETRAGKPIRAVHLMDREASGVLAIALTRSMARRAAEAFEAGRVGRRYLAVVAGPLEEEGVIRGKVRSRAGRGWEYLPARVAYRRLRGDERLSFVEVRPEGSRHHEVRALFAGAGRPLAGDLRYGRPKPSRLFLERFRTPYFLLHLHRLSLPRELLGTAVVIEAPVPETFRGVLEAKGWEAALAEIA